MPGIKRRSHGTRTVVGAELFVASYSESELTVGAYDAMAGLQPGTLMHSASRRTQACEDQAACVLAHLTHTDLTDRPTCRQLVRLPSDASWTIHGGVELLNSWLARHGRLATLKYVRVRETRAEQSTARQCVGGEGSFSVGRLPRQVAGQCSRPSQQWLDKKLLSSRAAAHPLGAAPEAVPARGQTPLCK